MTENPGPEPKTTKRDLELAVSVLKAAENAKKVADAAFSQAKTAFEEAVRLYQDHHDCYYADLVVPMGADKFVVIRSHSGEQPYVHEAR